jgi:hypothetical protein
MTGLPFPTKSTIGISRAQGDLPNISAREQNGCAIEIDTSIGAILRLPAHRAAVARLAPS